MMSKTRCVEFDADLAWHGSSHLAYLLFSIVVNICSSIRKERDCGFINLL